MGRAINKALAIACHFQEEKGKRVEILTQSIEVLDEITEDEQEDGQDDESHEINDEDKELTLKKRTISGIKLLIYP